MEDLNPVDTQVLATYGIAPGQIYADLDKRMQTDGRRVKVLSVASKPGKAACANCDRDGRVRGHTVWISFKRLSNKKLFALV